MKVVYFIGSVLGGLVLLVGLANGIEKIYPRGDENTDRAARSK